jgi:hypothetical protein
MTDLLFKRIGCRSRWLFWLPSVFPLVQGKATDGTAGKARDDHPATMDANAAGRSRQQEGPAAMARLPFDIGRQRHDRTHGDALGKAQVSSRKGKVLVASVLFGKARKVADPFRRHGFLQVLA